METNIAFLCTDVARQFRKRFDDAARSIGSTGAQWRVLLILQRSPGITQGKLAEFLDVEPITACRMVDRLEQGGLVERRHDPADRRVWQLFPTKEAEPVIAELKQIGADTLELATAGLSTDEKDRLKHYLSVIRDSLATMNDNEIAAEAHNG